MAIISIDTGILLSAISVIVSIFLFAYKTMSTKGEKSIIYGETVKRHEYTVSNIQKNIEYIMTKINSHDIDVAEMKRDLAYLLKENDAEKRDIESLRNRLEDYDNRRPPPPSYLGGGGNNSRQRNNSSSQQDNNNHNNIIDWKKREKIS